MKLNFFRGAKSVASLRASFLDAFRAGPLQASQFIEADERLLEVIRAGVPTDNYGDITIAFAEWCLKEGLEIDLAELLKRSPGGLGYYDVCSRETRIDGVPGRAHTSLHVAAVLLGSPRGLRIALKYAPAIETDAVLHEPQGAQRHYIVASRLARLPDCDLRMAARLAEVCRLLLGQGVGMETCGQPANILAALLIHPWSKAVAPHASRLLQLHAEAGTIDIDGDVPALGAGSPVETAALCGNVAAVAALMRQGCDVDQLRAGYPAADLIELVARYGACNQAETAAAIAHGLMERALSKAKCNTEVACPLPAY